MPNTPDTPGTPDAVHTDDALITSRDLDRLSPRLDTDDAVPLQHILRAAVRTRRSPEAIRSRLTELGFGRLPQGPLPEVVSLQDLWLLSRDVNGMRPWLEEPEGAKAPMGLILHVASQLQCPPREIAARFAALGYQVCDGARLPTKVRPEDLRLLSAERNSQAPWISDDEAVPLHHILEFAHSEDGPDETARRAVDAGDRLAELGYRVDVDVDVDVHVVTADDVRLIPLDSRRDPLLEVDEPIPLPHILHVAAKTGTGPAEVARRLRALGYRHLPDSPLPESAFPGDPVLTTEELHDEGSCLDRGTTVSETHVLRASETLECNPHEVANRLIALGYRLPYTPEPEDARLVSVNLDGRAPWLFIHADVDVGHVLSAALALDRRPAEIVERLAELGYPRPAMPVPSAADPDDLRVLRHERRRRAPWQVHRQRSPWLESNRAAPLAHVLRTALATGRSPREIAEHLAGLGYQLDPAAKLPSAAAPEDVRLLDAFGADFSVGPVSLGQILHLASHCGLSPAEVAARLVGLGFPGPGIDLPDVRPGRA